MEYEIRPEPTAKERQALVEALRRLRGGQTYPPPSRWREDVEEELDPIARTPRSGDGSRP